jgi:hypothetical protein
VSAARIERDSEALTAYSQGSFIAGVIAFKALPRQQFGHLQSRTFPPFFDFQLALTSALLGSWLWRHPGLLRFHRAPLSEPSIPASFNAWLLMAMVATTALNRWALGPWTTKCVALRCVGLESGTEHRGTDG